MIKPLVRSSLTRFGVATSRPAAFLVLLAFAALWLIFDRQSLDWHGIATLATWFMTLMIQRAEHRDTQAIHAKLDELLRADDQADERLAALDDEEPEEVERYRAAKRTDA